MSRIVYAPRHPIAVGAGEAVITAVALAFYVIMVGFGFLLGAVWLGGRWLYRRVRR